MPCPSINNVKKGPMGKKLRLLNLEDSPLDSELNLVNLEADGIHCELIRVETREDFRSALLQGEIDIILSDQKLPEFDGLSALVLAREHRPEIPFIFVTDSMGEEGAVETLKRGATDYVIKKRISRLGPVVRRALKEKAERQERLQAEQALRESEKTLASIFRATPAGSGIAVARVIHQVNDHLCTMVGYSREELIGKSTRIFYASDEEFNSMGEKYAQLIENGIGTVETQWRHKNGAIIEVLCSSAVIEPGNFSAGFTFTAMDITKRKEDEKLLKESEERFRCLAEATMEGVAVIQDGKILTANQTACEMFGYELSEVIGMSPLDFAAPESRELLLKKMEEGSEKPYELIELRKNGSTFIAEICEKAISYHGKPTRVTAIRDITERKKAEQELLEHQKQLQAMALRISEVEERERKKMARTLHDRVGQKLAALSLNLNIFSQLLSEDTREKIYHRMEESQKLLEEISSHTREIITELRPAVLDDFGLVAAIHWEGKQFNDRTGIHTRVKGDEFPLRLSPEKETIIFRIAQETLTNIAKHAKADLVDIILEKREDLFLLSIADNGCGFDFEGFRMGNEKGGWGLAFMNERAVALGGKLLLESESGKGTRVSLRLPL